MKKQFSKQLTFIFSIFALLGLVSFANSQTLFCPKADIVGFHDVHQRGNLKIGKSTTPSINLNLKFFITTKGKHIYIQSNYKPKGADYPFKLTSNEDVPFRNLINFLLFRGDALNRFDVNLASEFGTIFPTFFVEQKVFSHRVYKNLELPVNFVRVIGNDGVARKMRQLTSSEGIVKNILEVKPNMYVPMEMPEALSFVKKINAKPFNKGDVALLNLVTNTATKEKINQSIGVSNRIDFNLSSKDELKRVLTENQQRKVFVLGHVEGDSFVTLDTANKEVFRITISELEGIAKDAKVSIFALGCNSANETDIGTANAFNTVKAVEQLASAINSKNYGEFVSKLASPELQIVVDETIIFGSNRMTKINFLSGKTLGAAIVVATLIIFESLSDDDQKKKQRKKAISKNNVKNN